MDKKSFLILAVLASPCMPSPALSQVPGVRIAEQGVFYKGEYFGHNPNRSTQQRPQASPDIRWARGNLISDEQPAHSRYSGKPADATARNRAVHSTAEFPVEMPVGDTGEPVCDPHMPWEGSPCDALIQPCMPRTFLYADAGYLYGWTKGVDVPALATTSSQNDAGVRGLASTTVLFGDELINQRGSSGGRFLLGMDLDACNRRHVEFIFSFLDGSAETFTGSETGYTLLARPFFNVENGAEDSRLIVSPELVEGSLGIHAESDFQSYEVLHRQQCGDSNWGYIDFLLGYRAVHLQDDLLIHESTRSLSGVTSGTRYALADSFTGENTFHGALLGLEIQPISGQRWTTDCMLKIALGTTRQEARIAGSTTISPAEGDSSTTSRGLLTQASNIGSYRDNEFSAVSELGITLRYNLHPSAAFTIGYHAIFWNEVLRAGEQIDLGLNPTQIPPSTLDGESRPEFPFQPSGYWVQAIRIGLDANF